jgi:outer membrane protein assembly factor BamB
VADERGHVLAYDPRTGASVWKQDKLHARSLSRPAVVKGHVVVADHEGFLHWLSADDGHFVSRYRLGEDPIEAAPRGDGDVVYVADQEGRLAALRLARTDSRP